MFMENPTVSLFFRFDESMFLPLPERCLCAGLLFACVLVCRQQIRSTPPRTTFRTTRILTGKIQARLDAGGTRSCLPPSRCSFQLDPNSDSRPSFLSFYALRTHSIIDMDMNL